MLAALPQGITRQYSEEKEEEKEEVKGKVFSFSVATHFIKSNLPEVKHLKSSWPGFPDRFCLFTLSNPTNSSLISYKNLSNR